MRNLEKPKHLTDEYEPYQPNVTQIEHPVELFGWQAQDGIRLAASKDDISAGLYERAARL